jgi:methylated-DNA-[protein]-cysteine S-methyltransferase
MAGGIQTYMTFIGKVSISDDGMGNIDGIFLPNTNLPFKESKESPVMKKAAKQIDEYLTGKRKVFDVPLSFSGTDFQMSVWDDLRNIPYGKTTSYMDIAKRIGRPNAYRAVGNACGANPIPLIIPCHRVIASNGLGGFLGGLAMKKKLLEIEGIHL